MNPRCSMKFVAYLLVTSPTAHHTESNTNFDLYVVHHHNAKYVVHLGLGYSTLGDANANR